MTFGARLGSHLQQAGSIPRQETEERLRAEKVDVTLPGRKLSQGAVHPLSR